MGSEQVRAQKRERVTPTKGLRLRRPRKGAQVTTDARIFTAEHVSDGRREHARYNQRDRNRRISDAEAVLKNERLRQ